MFFRKIEFSEGGALKDARFWKSHIYFERRDVPVLSYTKNSISIFFRKIEFSEGGPYKMVVFGNFVYILKEEMPLHLPILTTQFRYFFEK
jgi:hypothetical protein